MSSSEKINELRQQVSQGLHGLAAFAASRVYDIAEELGVLDILSTPKSSNEIAAELALAQGPLLEMVLDTLRLSGILISQAERYSLAPNSAPMRSSLITTAQHSSGYIGMQPLTDLSILSVKRILSRELGPIDVSECLPEFDAAMGSTLLQNIRSLLLDKALRDFDHKSRPKILVAGGDTGYDAYTYSRISDEIELTVVRNPVYVEQSNIATDCLEVRNTRNIGWNELETISDKHNIIFLDVLSNFSPGIPKYLDDTKPLIHKEAKVYGFSLDAEFPSLFFVFAGLNGHLGSLSLPTLQVQLRKAGFGSPQQDPSCATLFVANREFLY